MERRDADDVVEAIAQAIVDDVFGPDPDFGQGGSLNGRTRRLLSDELASDILEQARSVGLLAGA